MYVRFASKTMMQCSQSYLIALISPLPLSPPLKALFKTLAFTTVMRLTIFQQPGFVFFSGSFSLMSSFFKALDMWDVQYIPNIAICL